MRASLRTAVNVAVIVIWLHLAATAYSQRLQFGVIGGTNLTSNFPTTDFSAPADAYGNPAYHFQFLTGPRSFIFGGVIEGRISERFSIEADVLHRPMKDTVILTTFFPNGASTTFTNQSTAVLAWEFPVLLKYTLPAPRFAGRFRPFLEAGPSFRTQENGGAAQPSRLGVSAGAGAAMQVGRFRISPVLRYTRWAHEDIYPRYATKQDQLEFLTSLTYATESPSLRIGGHTLAFGAVAGFSATDGFQGNLTEPAPYMGGLMVQMNVTPNLAVEGDAIYKPLHAQSDLYNFSVLTWQLPVLAKYRWAGSQWTPFAEAGPSFRLSGNRNGYQPSHFGVTIGGGVERRLGGVRLGPALRYTRWATDRSFLRTNPNAVELVVGVSF